MNNKVFQIVSSEILEQLHDRMKETYQFKDMNMLQHGISVSETYKDLVASLTIGDIEKIEEWIGSSSLNLISDISTFLKNQLDPEIMEHYQIYHDCGKPFCRTVDENGKQHFPNHAAISTQIYEQHFNNPLIAFLILNDMQFHTLKPSELFNWFQSIKDTLSFDESSDSITTKILCSLYLTAWSEIISNSRMFGGKNSTSFKIKLKNLINAGKKLIQYISDHNQDHVPELASILPSIIHGKMNNEIVCKA